MLAVFYGGLGWRPGRGASTPIALPPARCHRTLSRRRARWPAIGTRFRDALAHLVLPSIVLAATTIGLITRTTRAAMLEALQQDYVRSRALRAWGERAIMIGHVLPNALMPVVTLGGLAYAQFADWRRLTETIFSWPGLGRYTFQQRGDPRFPGDHGHHPVWWRSVS